MSGNHEYEKRAKKLEADMKIQERERLIQVGQMSHAILQNNNYNGEEKRQLIKALRDGNKSMYAITLTLNLQRRLEQALQEIVELKKHLKAKED